MRATLMMTDYQAAAKRLRCDVAAVQAVAEVESRGSGFLPDGTVRVLFEGHIFHRYTCGRHDLSHPTLSYPKWTRAHYAKGKNLDERGAREWLRLIRAMNLNREAALMSASYGRFQVMGFNFPLCGFTSVDEFFAAMQESEARQMAAFIAYVISVGLDDELRAHEWAAFARRYNGPDYRKNAYDTKLRRAHEKFSKSTAA